MSTEPAIAGIRREPPPFRKARVESVDWVTPRLVRMTLAGPDLAGFAVTEPAASVRLLTPSPGAARLEIPVWNGNEFLLRNGSRPVIRTLTPLRVDGRGGSMDVEIVVAHAGLLADWARRASSGDAVALSGPGRGYNIEDGLTEVLLAGDETALPAIGQLLDGLPGSAEIDVLVEIGDPRARLDLPGHPGARLEWIVNEDGLRPGTMLADRLERLDLSEDVRIWAAGEAAAMQRIRKHLFKELGLPRSVAAVRGYWKFGRAAPG